MFSKYMYFYFAKYTISVDIQWILRGGLFNQLVDYEDGKGEGGSNDFFFQFIYSVYGLYTALLEQWTTHCLDFRNPVQLMIPLLKIGQGQITASVMGLVPAVFFYLKRFEFPVLVIRRCKDF